MSEPEGKVVTLERRATEKATHVTRREVALLAVLKSDESQMGTTRSLANPWDSSSFNGIIEPPFDLFGLSLFPEQSSELAISIEAMEVNIPGYGYRLKRHPHAMDRELDEAARLEAEVFEDFLLYCDYDEESLTQMRRKIRKDTESTGNGYMEVIRDTVGTICAFKHVPSYQMRLMPLETSFVEVKQRRPVGRGRNRRFRDVLIRKRFRRFVQARFSPGGQGEPSLVFFKQYGDPRNYLAATGELITPELENRRMAEGNPISADEYATEIVHFKIYSPRSPYGVPRYIATLLDIVGNRASAEINYITFSNNNIPSMAVLVSGGQLTQGSVDRIEQFVRTAVQGQDNYSKILVIEAESVEDEDGLGGKETVRLDIKPLTREQHTDEMFQNYQKTGERRIRRSFRLPPIFTGATDEYTRATADVSRKIGDEQVFDPERKAEDQIFNRILRDMGMLYHVFETNRPNVTNDENLINVLTGAERAGGVTPRIARMILEDILGQELPNWSPKVDPDVPFSLQMAEAVKNLGMPNEPTQQIAPLKVKAISKALGEVGMLDPDIGGLFEAASFETEPNIVILDTGFQAELIASRTTKALVSDVRLKLAGRDLMISDGEVVYGNASFGAREHRVTVEEAAKLSGLRVADVQKIAGRESAEVWVYEISEATALPYGISYDHPDDSRFCVGLHNASLTGMPFTTEDDDA